MNIFEEKMQSCVQPASDLSITFDHLGSCDSQDFIITVRSLITSGVEPNIKIGSNSESLLNLVCRRDSNDCVEFLLDAGADIESTDKYGRTPLYNAVRYSHKDIVQTLLKRGAKINTLFDNQLTLLHISVWETSNEIIQILLDAGINFYAKCNNGYTALDHAGCYNSPCYPLLLAHKKMLERNRSVPYE